MTALSIRSLFRPVDCVSALQLFAQPSLSPSAKLEIAQCMDGFEGYHSSAEAVEVGYDLYEGDFMILQIQIAYSALKELDQAGESYGGLSGWYTYIEGPGIQRLIANNAFIGMSLALKSHNAKNRP